MRVEEGEEAAEQGETKAALALTADLIFASRIQGAARSAGVPVRIVRTGKDIVDSARAEVPRVILLDLEARRVNIVGVIEELRADETTASVPIVVFGPHVEGEALAAARAAGADRVMARSAFVQQLPRLVRGEGVAGGSR